MYLTKIEMLRVRASPEIRHLIKTVQRIYLPLLHTGTIQEDPSQHD